MHLRMGWRIGLPIFGLTAKVVRTHFGYTASCMNTSELPLTWLLAYRLPLKVTRLMLGSFKGNTIPLIDNHLTFFEVAPLSSSLIFTRTV